MASIQTNGALNFVIVSEVPPTAIMRRAYNASKQLEYFGWAPSGSSEDDPVWTIRKITYTDNQNTAEDIFFNGTWTDHASYTYA